MSVRSGAKFSMPGMMDTVLNLGLNEDTLQGLVALTGNERFGWDAYRRFIQMFGRIVMDVPGEQFDHALDAKKAARGVSQDTDLSAEDLREVADEFRSIVREATGRDFPADPYEQLDLAIKAVFGSWFGKRAMDYRNSQKIAHDLGTAVNVVTMVFGNMGDDSGTGVAFTRDPNTGEKLLFGEYLTNAQGEDVVAGIRTAPKISQMQTDMPEVYAEFQRIGQQLERHYRDVQDLEFTIERGRLYMLQTRSAKRTAAAAVRIAVDMVEEGLISKEEAVARIEPAHVDQLLRATFDQAALKGATKIVNGLNASPGAAVGRAVFDADTAVEWVDRGEKVILVRIETSPDDFHGMAVSQGIITARGGATSHAAVVARQIGKPCVAGSSDLMVDYARQAGALQRDRDRVQGRRLGQPRRLDRRALPRPAADGRGPLRGPARAPDDPRLGRRHPPDAGLDERRQARGGRPGAGLRRAGHRAVPHRAHVPRGRAPRDRAWRDPRREPGDARQGEGRCRARRSTPTSRRRSPPSTPRWPSSRCSSRATSRASSRRWTACRSSSGSSTRRSTSSCRTSRSSWSRSPGPRSTAARPTEDKELLATIKALHEQNPMLGLRGCPPRADDPGLREDPDAGDPQRPDRGQEGAAATRSPRS